MPRHEMSDDLKESLARLAAKLADVEQEAVGDPAEIAALLRDRLARYVAPSDLRPGDVCRPKAGLMSFEKFTVFILVRMLNPDDWFDRAIIQNHVERVFANRVDCIVAACRGEKEQTAFLPYDSKTLERFDPPAF